MPSNTPPKTKTLQRLDSVLNWFALTAGALSLILLTGLIVVDVTLRSVFNSPIHGAQDISILAMVVIVAASIPYTARSGMHVFVEVLEPVLGKLGCRISDVAVRITGCAVISVLVWLLILGAEEVSEFAETTPLLELSFGPFYFALALGFGFYAAILAVEALVLFFQPQIPRLDLDDGFEDKS